MRDLVTGGAGARQSRVVMPWRARERGWIGAGLACVAVAGLGFAGGGYFPVSWGWATLLLAWAVLALVLLVPQLALGRAEVVFLGLAGALTAWTFASALWASAPGRAILEGERDLVLFAGLLAFLLAARGSTARILGGIFAAIVAIAVWALATRLLPDRFGLFHPQGAYRLADPIGYWNGLGVLCAVGIVLGIGLAARAATPFRRGASAAAVVLLAPTVYFTFSRGAWIALGIGLAVALVLDSRRLQLITTLLLVAPGAALVVWLGSRSAGLTRRFATLDHAAHDGHRLALVLVLVAVLTGILIAVAARYEERLAVPRGARLAYGLAVAAVVVAAAGIVTVRYGTPPTIARKAYDAFVSHPIQTGSNLNSRLGSFSGNGRVDLWRVAWRESRHHPWLGGGAGSYEQNWLRYRPFGFKVRDAHNLYLETLAELGPPGLALLAALLLAPFAALARRRREPLVPIGLAALSVYIVHAAVDWDWELSAVTLAALGCGAAVLAAPRADEPKREVVRSRGSLVALAAAIGIAAMVGLAANISISASNRQADRGSWKKAERSAARAASWAPWSADAWRLKGEAEIGGHDFVGARASFRHSLGKDRTDWRTWYDLAAVTKGAAATRALAHVKQLNPYYRSDLGGSG